MIVRAALLLSMLSALPALAHGLVVFASVNGAEVVVETKFSNGRAAQLGTVTVFDATDTEVLSLPLGEGGVTRFPADPASGGYRIEVETTNGHSDYWLLTPSDLEGLE